MPFNRNEICTLRLKFHPLSPDILIGAPHQSSWTKNQSTCTLKARVYLFLQTDFEQYPLSGNLFYSAIFCPSFANINNLPMTHQQKPTSFLNQVFFER